MAIVQFEGQQVEVPDGSSIEDACEELGVPFGCHDGVCGTCISTVEQGLENLEEKNDKENDMDLGEKERLACQCVIRSGSVELSC